MIYNYRSMRDELRDAGYKFEFIQRYRSVDKSVALLGPGALDRLEGFFSFGLYDRNKKCSFFAVTKSENHSTGENGTEALCLHRAWMR